VTVGTRLFDKFAGRPPYSNILVATWTIAALEGRFCRAGGLYFFGVPYRIRVQPRGLSRRRESFRIF